VTALRSNPQLATSAALVFCAALPCVSSAADTLDVKVGEWQFTQTMTMSGAPIYIEAMTPAQRAAYAKAWQQDVGKPNTSSDNECISAKDVKEATLFGNQAEEGKQCTKKVSKATKTAWSATVDCKDAKTSTHTQADYTAPSPDRLTGLLKSSTTSPNGTTVMEFKFSGKWVGAVCTDGDDEDTGDESEDSKE
jgi:hypothetical protein